MNLLSFIKQFPSEDSCKNHFRDHRFAKGVICKKCQGTDHYWLSGKEQFQCKACGFRTTLRSGTILESSKLSYRYWYITLHLMSSTKKGFSAHEVRRQLGHKRYEPIWAMMKKIRAAMGKADDDQLLTGMIELDDAYFSTSTPKRLRKNLKRGKGSQKKSKVTVMVESFPLEVEGHIQRYCGYFKMKVGKSEVKAATRQIVETSIGKESVLFTDQSTSYVDLKNLVDLHVSYKSTKESVHELKWVHIAIANAKRNLLGIYHVIKEKYLQHYLVLS
jgi:ISXO2-like transposase domain/Transposase zinc-ribbon domain